MDFQALWQSMQQALGESLPSILGAIVILVAGWLVAVLVRVVVRKGLGLAELNRRIRSGTGQSLDVEKGLAVGAFWVVLLLALIAFFNVLNLTLVSEPLKSLVDQVFAYAPKLAAAGILILVAWVLALVLRKLATQALAATQLDDKLSAEAGMRPMSESLGNVLYWLVILLFLPGVLGALDMQGLLAPIQGMVDDILTMLPNLLAAAIIALVGWFVARLLRDLVTNLLGATGADGLGQKAGLRGAMSLSKLLGLLVYVFVLVPALIAAFDALKIEAISKPASEMLQSVMTAIPNIFAAMLILAVAYLVARFVAELVSNLLAGVGFDEVPQRLGIQVQFSGTTSPSQLVGKLIFFFGMVFATVEAANRLEFDQLSRLVAMFIEFGGQVLLGVLIIAVGLWISKLAYDAIRVLGGANSTIYAGLARFAILAVVFAMGLSAMQIGEDIITLAFGLTLGAGAVAAALAFGLGGREAAGRHMEHWLSRLRGGQ